MKHCQHCKKRLPKTARSHARFCSNGCRANAWNNAHPRAKGTKRGRPRK